MKKRILATLALSAATFAQAQQSTPTDWAKVKPMTDISVSTTDKAGVYKVSAVITDLTTARVIAKPVLLAAEGQPATVEFGSQQASSYKFVVTVDDKGHTASYRSEQVRAGVVESAQSGTLTVEAGS